MNEPYWRTAAEDEAMQDEHGFLWRAMLETMETDLTGRRVLDAGCNQGGFLRMLADRCGIARGYGYDPASAAVDDARRLAAGRPLTFEVSDTVPSGWKGFDIAFSHEVLYLLHDMPAHALAMFAALQEGGSYYAVMGVHAQSPLMAEWHAVNAATLRLPKLYDLDEVVGMFEGAGFEAAVASLSLRFVPTSAHRADHRQPGQLLDWLDYYRHDKVLLRFTRPAKPGR
jgi:SAM-dependent methyltransferase